MVRGPLIKARLSAGCTETFSGRELVTLQGTGTLVPIPPRGTLEVAWKTSSSTSVRPVMGARAKALGSEGPINTVGVVSSVVAISLVEASAAEDSGETETTG